MSDVPRRGAGSLIRFVAATVTMSFLTGQEVQGQQPKSDLNLAHEGSVAVDTAFLNRAPQPESVRAFFAAARNAFDQNPRSSFAKLPALQQAAEEQGLTHLGGPMLGALSDEGARVWVRTVRPAQVTVLVETPVEQRVFGPILSTAASDLTAVVPVTGLEPATRHAYRVLIDGKAITMPADAAITTASRPDAPARMKIAFGGDFHKSGLWNWSLLEQIRQRGNAAMLLLGDNAVDDRNASVGLHRSDYLLRDLSPAWQDLAASVPIYATWDDHDYFDNDRSGIPRGFTEADRAAVWAVWRHSWNNPSYGFENRNEGIFFRTRIGPCDLIMLDTRFFRAAPGAPDSFLGKDQADWLGEQLAACAGPFIILTSGTMWSDTISDGKDSWGKWDPETRERIFALIEERRLGGILLLSGDRHGSRVVRITRPSGFAFHEFELGSLGAHAGPPAMGERAGPAEQPFGLIRTSAFGELAFDTTGADPTVTMRIVDDAGQELYEVNLTRDQLTPPPR